jgi:hypothetical protein
MVDVGVPESVPDTGHRSVIAHTNEPSRSLNTSCKIRHLFDSLFDGVGLPKLDVAGSIPVSRSIMSTTCED